VGIQSSESFLRSQDRILVYLDFSTPFFIETNASNFALGAALSQEGQGIRLHPVAFYSKFFFTTELNYEIHDSELLVIMNSFQLWRYLLEGASH
jgi:hypothetical protein